MTRTSILALFAATGVAFSAPAFAFDPPKGEAPATDKEHKDHDHKDHDHKDHDHKHDKAPETAKIGEPAPAFTLTDTDGKTVNLSDFKGKVVVLEWFNPECPFIVKHHAKNTTFNDLYTQYNTKNVVFLAINSSAEGKQGYGKKLNQEKKTAYKMQYPILLDEDGKVGRAYAAKTTPHCFIIDTEGKLAYGGAIDNDTSPDKAGSKNYVKNALDEILAGKPVSESSTRPYGCSVKYGK